MLPITLLVPLFLCSFACAFDLALPDGNPAPNSPLRVVWTRNSTDPSSFALEITGPSEYARIEMPTNPSGMSGEITTFVVDPGDYLVFAKHEWVPLFLFFEIFTLKRLSDEANLAQVFLTVSRTSTSDTTSSPSGSTPSSTQLKPPGSTSPSAQPKSPGTSPTSVIDTTSDTSTGSPTSTSIVGGTTNTGDTGPTVSPATSPSSSSPTPTPFPSNSQSTTNSSTGASSPTSSSTTNDQQRSPIPTIAGTVSGLFLLIFCVAVLLYLRSRKRRASAQTVLTNAEPYLSEVPPPHTPQTPSKNHKLFPIRPSQEELDPAPTPERQQHVATLIQRVTNALGSQPVGGPLIEELEEWTQRCESDPHTPREHQQRQTLPLYLERDDRRASESRTAPPPYPASEGTFSTVMR